MTAAYVFQTLRQMILTLTRRVSTLESGGGSGTVTTTGSPASGNLTKFSGATSITNADLSGDVTTSGTVATTIANDAVSNAKLANMAASTIKARKTASTGDPEDCTLSEILDFIGSAAQGDILYRGSSGWARLAAGTSGYFLKTNGASNNPAWAAVSGGAGGAYPDFTAPVLGDFAWINQGSATIAADTWQGVTTNYLGVPANSGASQRIRKKAAPSTPYVITAAFLVNWLSVDNENFGLCFRQSSDGKLHLCGMNTGASTTSVFTQKWTSPTVFSASYSSVTRFWCPSPVWLRIEDNGTNRIFSLSADGHNWMAFHTIGRTDFLTADEVGWFGNCSNTTNAVGVTLLSWAES